MNAIPDKHRPRLNDVACILAGVLFPFSLAPFDFWPLALLSAGLLFFATTDGSTGRTLTRFYLFNVSMFGTGVWWIFVSVHVYGYTSLPLAIFLVTLLVLSYSLVCLPQAWLYARWFRQSSVTRVSGFTGLWVLQEWFRSWFLTGFPWLLLGYSAIDTPLEHYAPVTGVYGVSLVVVIMAVTLAVAVKSRQPAWALPAVILVLVGLLLGQVEWTQKQGSVSVSLVQGNVDQHSKWHRQNRLPIYNLYNQLSADEWGRDLVIWPEAALTVFREQADALLAPLDARARERQTSLLLGMPDRNETGGFQNTVIALGDGDGQYIKRRLVPFGEYVPMEDLLRGVIRLFDLPMSRNRPGPIVQAPLKAGDLNLSLSICYEVIYPALVRNAVANPDLLVTVSNDTWFGESIGPVQHFQMARMRALENGRYLARATNNGVTAVIDHRGKVSSSLPQFTTGVLRDDAEVRSGLTPFHRVGSLPVILLSFLLLAGAGIAARRTA